MYPEEYKPILCTFNDKMLESLNTNGLPIESGTIGLGKLNDSELLVYLFFLWHSSTNESIDNMNITLADMQELGKNYFIFRGSPKVRFYLLIKTFFNEIYRIRDMLNQFLSGLQKLGKIKKTEIKGARAEFSEIFDKSIEIRNSLVHGHPTWKGKGHFDISLVLGAAETGHALVDKETGKIWDVKDVLKENTEFYFAHMKEEGLFIRTFLQNLSETMALMYKLS